MKANEALRAVIPVICLALIAFPAAALRVECTLQHTLPGLLSGVCTGMSAESAIALEPVPGSDTDWTGAITLGNNPGLIDVVSTQYGSEYRYIFRSTIDWFNVSEFDTLSVPARLVFDRSDLAAPTSTDLAILARARNLLETARQWDKSDDRNCGNDEPGVIGLYCALIQATAESEGKYYHRQPALQAVRRVVDELWRERTSAHRLEDFNNSPETTMDEVYAAISKAEDMIKAGLVDGATE